VRGVVGGRASLAGRAGFVSESCGALDARWAEAIEQARESGHTEVLVGWDGQVHGVIAVADTVKPTSRAAVTRLRELGLHPVLLSGDHQAAADRVAAEVGIDDVIAEVAPADKVAAVRQLQEGGHQVAMVGDGVNDAAALAQADLGIAMSSGSDVAIESSDITLVRSDLSAVPDAIALSRRTLAVIRGNLFWAFGYNIAAIPLAASGRLSPVIAAGAMAFSSVLVVTNSLRLRGFRPAPSNPGSVG
jgi:Cu+-exporting ATPase